MNITIPIIRSSVLVCICINTILKLYTSPKDHVVSLNNDFVLDVPVFYDFPHPRRELEEYPFRPDIYVADLKDMDLASTLKNLREKYQLNSKAKFIFISENVTTYTTEILAKQYVRNVIFIDPISEKISTYNPYNKKLLYDIDTAIIEIGNCSDISASSWTNRAMFENKTPERWNQSLIKMCLMFEPPYSICGDCEEKGINVDIFNLVIKFINMVPQWSMIDFPEDGDFNKYYYKYLHTNEYCDIHVGLLTDIFYDYSIFYVFDEIYFFSPSPDLLPRWKYLLRALTLEIWICWIITMLVLSGLWLIFRKVHDKNHDAKVALEIIWTNVEYFVEQYHNISPGWLSFRFLFLSLFFLSCLMNMIFKSNFNFILTGINFEEPIDSIADIIKTGMTVGFLNDDSYGLLTDDTRDYFKSHYKLCNYSYLCFNQTAFEKNLISYQSLRFYKYIQDAYVDKEGIPLMRLVKPHVLTVWLCGLLPLGHPVTDSLNIHLSYLDAHGFINFILSKYDNSEIQTPSNFKTRMLSFEHILAPSVILLVGFTLGFVMFVLEIYQYI